MNKYRNTLTSLFLIVTHQIYSIQGTFSLRSVLDLTSCIIYIYICMVLSDGTGTLSQRYPYAVSEKDSHIIYINARYFIVISETPVTQKILGCHKIVKITNQDLVSQLCDELMTTYCVTN